MTDTDQRERTRRELLAKGDPYRSQLLADVELLIANVKDIKAEQERDRDWRIQHDKDDALRFAKGDARMETIEKSIEGSGGIRSGVNDYQDTRAQIKGIRNFIVGAVLVIGTCYGAIRALGEIATWFASLGKHP